MLPPFLNFGDHIRIVSPAGSISSELIDGAVKVLTSWGLKASVGAHAYGEYGRFSATKEQRLMDLQAALDDVSVKAILCSRGGYGIIQYIDKLDFSTFLKHPKWLVGFSDVTILHNAINKVGIASLHAIMTKHIVELSATDLPVQTLKDVLFGKLPTYEVESNVYNRCGDAKGMLVGGNLAVLLGMRATPYDLDFENKILFIEDIAEEPYKIDRMLQNLRISGVLSKLKGLVVGQFTDCTEDSRMMQTVSAIIADAVKTYDYPVCFNFPAGHVDFNLALIMGGEVELHVTLGESTIRFY